MSINNLSNTFVPYTINGLQDVNTDSQTTQNLQVLSLNPNKVVVSDNNSFLVSAGTSSTEIDYLIGTSSNIQSQINSKASITYVDTQDTNLQNQINTKASTTYVDTNFLNKTTATQQNITPFCNFNSIGATTIGMSNGLQWYKNSAFEHPLTIVRQIGTGSILKDLVFRDNENNVDTLLLSEDGQTVYVGLKCDYTTASKIPIFDSNKKLVSSGVDSIKITYLDNVSSDIQTQLNNKLNLSGNNANQNIIINTYKVQSSATPTTGNDYTNKTYVDGQISGLSSVYLPLAGGTMTGNILGTSSNYLRWGRTGDVRNNLAPNSVPGESMAWYFGTYDNNNLAPFADHLILNGWVDTSGGLTNMISYNKGGKGIRQYQQTFGSSTKFTTWYDCVLTDANSSDVSIGGVLTAPTINISSQIGSRVCVFDASKNVVSSTVSSTTLTYLDISSSLTGLLNNKADITYVNAQLALKSNLTGGNTFSGDQVFNSGTVSVSSRLLGEPLVSGNFLIGLRGTGTDSDRLGIAISGNSTTGAVSFVVIPKTLTLPSIVSQRVLILDSSNNVQASSVDSTTLTYLDIDSSLTGLLNLKANLAGTNTFTGTNTFSSATPLTLSGLTASRVLQLNSSGNVESSSVSTTTLGYLDATSSIQTQLNAKANLSGGNTFTGFQTYTDRTASRVAVFDAGKRLVNSNVTLTELTFLSGVTSEVQTQINSKVSKAGDIMTGELKFTNNVITEWGVGLTKEVNAYKIGASWVTANSLDIVGGGTTAGQRQVVCYDKLGVGIAPTALFTVNGSITIKSTNGVYEPGCIFSNADWGMLFRGAVAPLSTGGHFVWYSSAGTELMRINTSGNLGVGTNPDTKLHTYEFGTNVIRLQTSSVDNAYLIGNHEYLSLNANSDSGGIRTNTGRGSSAIILQQPSTGGGYIRFFTSPNINTNIEERMRITANGYVGIGIPSAGSYVDPLSKFTINSTYGAGGENSGLCINATDGTVYNLRLYPYVQAGGQVAYQFRVNNGALSTNSMTIGYNGNIGIGTVNPITVLHLARAFSSDTDYTGMISFENTQAGGYIDWQIGPQVIGGAGCFGIRGGTDGFSGLNNLLTIRAVSSTQGYFGINTTTPSAPLTVNGSITIKSGTNVYEAGCIYSDVNWGMLFRGAVAPASGGANFGWYTSTGSELMRLNAVGSLTTTGAIGVNMGSTVPTGVLDVYSTSADYTNSVVIRTPWSSVVLDNTQVAGGRKWSILNGGPGAGVGIGGFGIFDITASAYRFSISPTGNVTIPGNLSVGTISAVNTAITTYNNTDNRLMFRDGSGAITVGACTFWNYSNTSVAWTYGTSINNAFYVPSTTATIQIQITGSGYSTFVGNTTFRVIAYDAVNTPYTSTISFFFNQGSVHTQVTQHITIPNNAWGGNTIGYKRLFIDWYSGGTYIASDSNDTLNYSISVIG